MKNLIFLVLILLIGLNYTVTGQTKNTADKKTINKTKEFVIFEGKRVEVNSIDLEKISAKKYNKLLKDNPSKKLLFAEKDAESWLFRVDTSITDSSMNFKKEFASINRTKNNIGNGVDYQPIYKSILKEAKKHGNEKVKKQAKKINKKLVKIFYKRGHVFDLNSENKEKQNEKHAKTCFFLFVSLYFLQRHKRCILL